MKSIRHILQLAVVLVLFGCMDQDLFQQFSDIHVTADLNSSTRTTFVEDGNVMHVEWNAGDKIGLFTQSQQNIAYTATTSGIKTDFTPYNQKLKAEEGEEVFAYYPYKDSEEFNIIKLPNISLQNYRREVEDLDFIYTRNEIEGNELFLHFKHLFAFLKITVPINLFKGESNRQFGLFHDGDGDLSCSENAMFDLSSEEIQGEKSYRISYFFPDQSELGDITELTCYIAILPQPAGTRIRFAKYDSSITTNFMEMMFTKEVPAEGFLPGHVYTLSIEQVLEEAEQQKRKERQALIDLYNATDGDHWTNNENWCSDKPLNEWYGVYVNDGQVYRLGLGANGLQGVIPESIGNLVNINFLNLAGNQLSGSIPESIGNLVDIRYLYLNNNQLSGSIPESIGNLVDICYLLLNDNQLSGLIPESIVNLANPELSYLYLDHNYLSGRIPDKVLNSTFWITQWPNIIPQWGEGLTFPQDSLRIPSFKVITREGETITDEIFARNKLTVLYKWDHGCFPSWSFVSVLNDLYAKYKEKGFAILGISYDDMNTYQKAVKEAQIGWPSFYPDENQVFPLQLPGRTPTTLIVDQDGVVVYNDLLRSCDIWTDVPKFVAERLGEAESYTSTDYSKDGEVFTIQKATVGKGIDLVFMGEGFVDKDMETGGKYEQTMQASVDKFFEIEPYKSFRNRFNAYGVKVVSPNAEFFGNAKHALNEDDKKAFEYVNKVTSIKSDAPRYAIVVYNFGCTGRSYTRIYGGDNSFVAWNMEGANEVLIHEACGHGFAKLGDEYVEPGFENQTFTDFEGLDSSHGVDWYMNVDYHSAKSDVIWKHFLEDSRYNGQVGIYEGSFTYGFGAYRSTENSMMRYNDSPFNAPSREAIYKAIMKASEGDNWKYNYEDFVKYDEVNRNAPATRSTSSPADIEQWKQNHRPPVIVKGSWRDAMNNKNQIIVPLR